MELSNYLIPDNVRGCWSRGAVELLNDNGAAMWQQLCSQHETPTMMERTDIQRELIELLLVAGDVEEYISRTMRLLKILKADDQTIGDD